MPGFRRSVHALGLGLLAFTSACLDDAPSATAELSSSAGLVLRAVADLGAAAERDIGIRVYYLRGATQVDLPAEPSRVRVTGGETRRQAVTVQLASCLADPGRDGAPAPGCLLHVELRLLDAAGATLDLQVSQPSGPSAPGQSVELPTIALSEVASVSLASVPALRVQESRTLAASALAANGQPITGRTFSWASSNPSVATVNQSGAITAVAAGTTTISATTGVRTGELTVRVIPRVATVTVTPATATMNAGATQQLTLVARDAAGTTLSDLAERTITWQSSAPAVATVDAAGRVTGARAGTAQITASVDGIAGNTTITVVLLPITIAPPSGPVLVARTIPLVAEGAVGTITWSSSDATIASVDANGVVTARFPGTATITASTAAGQSATVPVESRAASTAVTRATFESVSRGYSFSLSNFVAYDADNQPIAGVVPQWSVASGPMSVGPISGGIIAATGGTGLGPATLVAREARTGALLRTDNYNVLRSVFSFFTEQSSLSIPEAGSDTLLAGISDSTGGQANRILQVISSAQSIATFPARVRTDGQGTVRIPVTAGLLPASGPTQVTFNLIITVEGQSGMSRTIPVTVYRPSAFAIVAPSLTPTTPRPAREVKEKP